MRGETPISNGPREPKGAPNNAANNGPMHRGQSICQIGASSPCRNTRLADTPCYSALMERDEASKFTCVWLHPVAPVKKSNEQGHAACETSAFRPIATTRSDGPLVAVRRANGAAETMQ